MKNKALLILVAMIAALIGCTRANPAPAPSHATSLSTAGELPALPAPGAPIAPVAVPGMALGDGEHTVGAPKVIGNLAMFPVYASVQEQLGEFSTLEAAIERGEAVVKERGADAPPPPPAHKQRMAPQTSLPTNNDPLPQAAASFQGGATVNQLVIDNQGNLPILVLAGTVVKGGRQDRQISQDFVVGPKEIVAVDAFCVEHGRWSASRNGADTGGRFHTVKTLANGQVREAGQYKKDQSQVWSKVGEVNSANKKQASTGTLMATVDDAEFLQKRTTIAKAMLEHLGKVEAAESVVGIAYAVDGKVRGVRWFFNHTLFAKHGETLVNTAVLDGLTAQAARESTGQTPLAGACDAAEVGKFIARVEQGKVEQRDTAAQNVNEVKEADVGYSSSARLKAPAKHGGKSKPVTTDYLSK
jgi:hypothetical protein